MRIRFAGAFCAILILSPVPSGAIVNATREGSSHAASVVMVLHRDGARAGFCSGAVIGAKTILTAAHCVGGPEATRVHFRSATGTPVLLPVARVTRHPGYRADAVAARARSIDLAIVETRDPLPSVFTPIAPGFASQTPGARFTVAGFGVAREGDGASSGVLREADLALRDPVSNLLLWLEGGGAGACTGDSGAPVFDSAGALVGIVAFAQGRAGRGCGGLTQAVRVDAARDWIETNR